MRVGSQAAREGEPLLPSNHLTRLPPCPAQVTTEWRKISSKLEGEPEFDALDKIERLETFQVGMLWMGL